MKVLSPAGNFECLKTAIFNGADEVYLGINDFNARNNIDGFTIESLKEGVDFAHFYGVRVLLAINILFSDGEIQTTLDTVIDAYNLGVDAFIIQDLGLISLLYKNYPQIEIHASTQMGLHNLEGVREVVKYGVKRVVLARETPLSEIKRIKDNVDVEIEYFAHGALCVSFSGNCYLSSYLFGASGNRGRCKQLCRLPFTFFDGRNQIKKGYLLSAKDFNMVDRLKDLENVGVDVLKIEGRARRPFYVATATKAYKDALNGRKIGKQDLELAFNRTFTEGYFNGNGNMISDIQNHIGVYVGKVEKVNAGKTFNEIFISSNIELTPKSTFKFFNGNKENNTLTAFDLSLVKKGLYRITTTQRVNVGDSVRLIVDAEKENAVSAITCKIEIDIRLEFKQNQQAKATVKIENFEFIIEGEVAEPALKQPLTKDEICKNFSKSSDFNANITVDLLDDVFMPKQKLNEFRRRVFDKAKEILTSNNRELLNKIKIDQIKSKNFFKDFVVVENHFEELNAKNVIYSPEIYDVEQIKTLKERCEINGKNLFLDTPNFALEKDIEMLKGIIENTGVKIVANNYFALGFNAEKIIGYGLNVYNAYTAKEHNLPFIMAEDGENLTAPFMTLRHCPIKTHIGCECNNCKYHDGFSYKMEGDKSFNLKRKKLSSCTFYLV